jgi:ketosteroid isomerase-like protein
MGHSSIFLLAAVIVTLSGCAPTPSLPPDLRAEDTRKIRDGETAWNRDYTRKDVERLTSRYSEDATLMAPNVPAASGTQAIRAALKQAMEDGNFSMSFESSHVEVSLSGDLAFAQGNYHATRTDVAGSKPVNDTGMYVMVYRKQPDGVWKAVADIRTSSLPPEAGR